VRQWQLQTAPDRVTGAEPTNDDTMGGVCRRSLSGRPGLCSSCAPTANVATSIFRPRRRRRWSALTSAPSAIAASTAT